MNSDPKKSAQSCGCDEGAKHMCLACASTGKGYGYSQRVSHAPEIIKTVAHGIGVKWPPLLLRTDSSIYGLFPDSAQGRKDHPVFTGVLMYFPDALAAVAHVSKLGNDQHNPGQPFHWARGKSTDQMDTATRHMMDHGVGDTRDSDGAYHLAKAAWRILAELQLTIERDKLRT